MPQPCRICNHPQREAIDAELSGAWERSLRAIGVEYGVTKDSLQRHSQAHLVVVEDKISADAEGSASNVAEISVEESATVGEPRQTDEQEMANPWAAVEMQPISEWDNALAELETFFASQRAKRSANL